MNKKRAHIFTAEKPNMQLSRIISAITFIFARQNGYEVVDVIADYIVMVAYHRKQHKKFLMQLMRTILMQCFC